MDNTRPSFDSKITVDEDLFHSLYEESPEYQCARPIQRPYDPWKNFAAPKEKADYNLITRVARGDANSFTTAQYKDAVLNCLDCLNKQPLLERLYSYRKSFMYVTTLFEISCQDPLIMKRMFENIKNIQIRNDYLFITRLNAYINCSDEDIDGKPVEPDAEKTIEEFDEFLGWACCYNHDIVKTFIDDLMRYLKNIHGTVVSVSADEIMNAAASMARRIYYNDRYPLFNTKMVKKKPIRKVPTEKPAASVADPQKPETQPVRKPRIETRINPRLTAKDLKGSVLPEETFLGTDMRKSVDLCLKVICGYTTPDEILSQKQLYKEVFYDVTCFYCTLYKSFPQYNYLVGISDDKQSKKWLLQKNQHIYSLMKDLNYKFADCLYKDLKRDVSDEMLKYHLECYLMRTPSDKGKPGTQIVTGLWSKIKGLFATR